MQGNYYLQSGTRTLHPSCSPVSQTQPAQPYLWSGPHDPTFPPPPPPPPPGLLAYQVRMNVQDHYYLQTGTRTPHPSYFPLPQPAQPYTWTGPSWPHDPTFLAHPGLPSYQWGRNMQNNYYIESGPRTLHPSYPALPRCPQTQQWNLPSMPRHLTPAPSPASRGQSLSSTRKKCYDPYDRTLTFVDREDEFDFLCEGFKSPRALMSCGHAVTPMSLTKWCQRQLDEGKTRFVCGQTRCNVEWSYKEVCKMALLTPQEQNKFKKAMKSNAARRNTRPCPVCKSPVLRSDPSNLRVRCTVCTATNRRIYEFCWQCLREWRGPAPRSDHCDNDGCSNESLKTLQTCPEILLYSVKCPSIRACPTCGILLQHDKKGCKNVKCPRCRSNFCFVCLRVPCSQCSLAPRQTSIPVWQEQPCK